MKEIKPEKRSRKAHELKKSRAGHEEWQAQKRQTRRKQVWVPTGQYNANGKEIYVSVHP